jgi:hypothetical protein
MGKARLVSIATAAIVAFNLGAVTGVDAAQRGGDLCVAVSGGVVENATVIDVVADGGTSIGDASGGSGNLAFVADGGNENERDNGNNNGNNNNGNGNGNGNNNNGDENGNGNGNNGNGNGNNGNGNGNGNRNDWSAESLQTLELRLEQTDTASAGNAGVATASADGGAVSIQDINSGGNAGNAIAIGDTVCPGAAHAPAGGGGAKAPAGNVSGGGGGGRGGQVRALPSTGIGLAETGASASLLLALGALGFMGLSLGSRLDRRVSPIAGR